MGTLGGTMSKRSRLRRLSATVLVTVIGLGAAACQPQPSSSRHLTPLSGATAVETGGNHSCAIVADGAVKCWGLNISGQLGTGTAGGSITTAVDVVGVSGAT